MVGKGLQAENIYAAPFRGFRQFPVAKGISSFLRLRYDGVNFESRSLQGTHPRNSCKTAKYLVEISFVLGSTLNPKGPAARG